MILRQYLHETMLLAESQKKYLLQRWTTCVVITSSVRRSEALPELSVALSRRSDIVVVVEVHGSTGNFQASQLQLKEQQSASSISVLALCSQDAQVSTVTGISMVFNDVSWIDYDGNSLSSNHLALQSS